MNLTNFNLPSFEIGGFTFPSWAVLIIGGMLLVLLSLLAILLIFMVGGQKQRRTASPAPAGKDLSSKEGKKGKKARKPKGGKKGKDEQPDPADETAVAVKDPASEITDEHLSEVVDAIAKRKGVRLQEHKQKKEKKPPAGAMQQRLYAKRSGKNLKKKGMKLQIPKTVQETIPYYAVYEEDGIIEIKQGVFTRSYLLGDVNYQIAKQEEQHEMFMFFGQLLNSFDPTMNFQITINQKNINMDEFEQQTMLPLEGDSLDELRVERNEMLKRKIMEGKNHLVKEKYLTVAVQADSLEAAQTAFIRLDAEIDANVKKIGNATATPLTSSQRLEILHDIYNIGDEGFFGNNMTIREGDNGHQECVFAEEKFRFDIMRRMGLTTKDMIAPESFHFKGDYGMIGDMYFRALFLDKIPSFLVDDTLFDLTNTECNMVTSLHYQALDGEKAQKLVSQTLTNINASLLDKQKKASRSGYSFELISPQTQEQARETAELLDDINNKNQKMFYVSTVIVHFAETKEQLDTDTKAIQTIARGKMCSVKKLSQQQENGLNTVLPLAYNQLSIKRSLTTESAAILMPFANQELNEPSGLYYGNNAVSHNLLKLDRRARKNGNGFIFGTPGSGKSMGAKQEMLDVLLSSPDTVLVIDPEGEYSPMAEMLGDEVAEVIRIATGADVHINPFDIDLSADSGGDDPMAIKADFIVSLCEAVIGERYGLAPSQRSIIDRCVKKAYEPYLASRDRKTGKYDEACLPTLKDFYAQLRMQSGYEAMQLADSLELFIEGSQNIFAYHTNVEYTKRFVVFDIKELGATLKPMALLVLLDFIWNRMVQGREECRYTWFYVDEIYLLFKNAASAEFLKNLYKRARKYFGLPTGITQNVTELLENDVARTMISNCEHIQMFNQAPLDRAQLADLLNMSPTQLGFVTNAGPGEGLLYDGRVIVPFVNKLPKETKQYMAMTTKPSEIKEREEQKALEEQKAAAALPESTETT